MRVPLPLWPQHSLSVPIGLSLYLKEAQARKLKLPYQSRSALAHEMVDFVAAQLPDRRLRVRGEGGYATQECLRQLLAAVHVVSRMLITGKLYDLPPCRRGRAAVVRPQKAPYWALPKPSPGSATAGSHIPPKRAPWCKPGRACGTRCCPDA
jgi:hypothetical protein